MGERITVVYAVDFGKSDMAAALQSNRQAGVLMKKKDRFKRSLFCHPS